MCCNPILLKPVALALSGICNAALGSRISNSTMLDVGIANAAERRVANGYVVVLSGICNAALGISRISNSTMLDVGIANAAERGRILFPHGIRCKSILIFNQK